MPTLDKSSLREDFAAYKADYENLCRQGKVSPECKAIFDGLLLLMQLLIAVFLERTTPKESGNSGIPSSQTSGEDETASKLGSKGKGPKCGDDESENTRRVESTTVSKVTACPCCGRDMSDVGCCGHERRTLIDIVFEIRREHVDAEIKVCPDCATETRGTFPDTMPGPLQYGLGIIAFAVHMLTAQMVPLKRTAQVLKTITGRSIAEATLLSWVWRLHVALAAWEAAAIEQILAAPVMHADETSIRIKGKNHWLHSYSAGNLTVLFCHPKRGRAAVDDLNIIPRYGGVLVHDRWATYLSYDNCRHALCGSHLLRDLQFIIDSNGHGWARSMKKLLKEAARKVSKSESKTLTDQEFKAVRKRYRTILTKGKRELPEPPPRPPGKRGRIAKSDAENLHEALSRYEDEVLRFTREAEVPFTNNVAERSVRMSKVKQKISGCFRSLKFAEAYCRISSYIKTTGHQGINPLVAIGMALTGKAVETLETR